MTDDELLPGIPGWALDQALAETLAETVQLTGREFPPGLSIRFVDEWIEVLSRTEVIGKVSHSGLLERAREIATARRRQ